MIMDRLDEFGVTFVGGEAVGDLEQVLQSVEKTLGALIPRSLAAFPASIHFRLRPTFPPSATAALAARRRHFGPGILLRPKPG